MWRANAPDPADVRRMRAARDRLNVHPVVIHCNYLANLASIDPEIREKSVRSFRGELDRAAAIGAEYLVLHPGNHRDQPLQQGIAAFVLGLAEAADGFDPRGLTVLLENTAGSANQIGSKFEELRMIRDLAARETALPLGYCLDTCHRLAAGFDVSGDAGVRHTVAAADQVLGLEHVRVVHANDSKGRLGSHLDRHENIGRGFVGEAGFRAILTHPGLRDKAFILETPVEDDDTARADIAALIRLSA